METIKDGNVTIFKCGKKRDSETAKPTTKKAVKPEPEKLIKEAASESASVLSEEVEKDGD